MWMYNIALPKAKIKLFLFIKRTSYWLPCQVDAKRYAGVALTAESQVSQYPALNQGHVKSRGISSTMKSIYVIQLLKINLKNGV